MVYLAEDVIRVCTGKRGAEALHYEGFMDSKKHNSSEDSPQSKSRIDEAQHDLKDYIGPRQP